MSLENLISLDKVAHFGVGALFGYVAYKGLRWYYQYRAKKLSEKYPELSDKLEEPNPIKSSAFVVGSGLVGKEIADYFSYGAAFGESLADLIFGIAGLGLGLLIAKYGIKYFYNIAYNGIKKIYSFLKLTYEKTKSYLSTAYQMPIKVYSAFKNKVKEIYFKFKKILAKLRIIST